MIARLSLRWKILAWLFLNLLVLGVAVTLFLRAQFGAGLNSLLAGPAGDRLETLGQVTLAALGETTPEKYEAALESTCAAWRERGVRAALFRTSSQSADFVAGDFKTLPPLVFEAVKDRMPGLPQRVDRPSFGLDPPPGEPGFRPPGGEREPRPVLPPPARPPDQFTGPVPVVQPAPPVPRMLQKFMLVSREPRTYWAAVRLGWPGADRRVPGGFKPVTLVLASDSIRGGGLFFDYVPWLMLGGALLALSLLFWLPFVTSLTRSLARLTRSAEAIAEGTFEPPPDTPRQDELGRLNRAHQHMATQLDSFVAGQKRFLGDTAHELLSPLARLEVALSILEHRAAAEDQRYIDKALDETRQMTGLLHDLLSFSKAGLGGAAVSLQPVALAPLVAAVVARETAEKPGTTVVQEIPPDHVVLADAGLLDRAVANGLRNALRYAGDAGPISLTSRAGGDRIMLTLADQGPGVEPALLTRLFDPFFRPDDSRVRETGGAGLGLAIVKSATEACRGTVSLNNRVPRGLELAFSLERCSTGD